MYIGSFSTWGDPPGRGLDIGEVDLVTGALILTGAVKDVPDASWLEFSRDRRILYCTNELVPDGMVTALALRDPHLPTVIDRVSSGGAGPTHLSVHPSGRYLLTANYTGGSVAVHRLEEDGRIGPSTDVVQHAGSERDPHAHQVVADPTGRWVLAVDLGADSVFVYGLDLTTGRLTPNQQLRLPSGSGPRHLAFHPLGRCAYILGELRSEITVAEWNPATGRLSGGQVVPTTGPHGPRPNFPAEIAVSRDGRFVYVSNRGEDTIATFAVADHGRELAFAGAVSSGGSWPRHFTLSPDERWVYVSNQRSNSINWLPRDPASGRIGTSAGSARVHNVGIVLFP